MLDVADGLYNLDQRQGRLALQRAQQMVDIVEEDAARSSSYSVIASLWAHFGDIRLARLAAQKDSSAASALKSYVAILDAASLKATIPSRGFLSRKVQSGVI